MKITTEEFLISFHDVSRVTMQEARKIWFLYLKGIDPNDVDIDFTMVQPKIPLEAMFKIDALLYFKRVPDLLEVLKCENSELIRPVLKKNYWFIKEAFKNVSGEELVSVVFPHVSLKVKFKIINKLCKTLESTRCADEYFEAIKSKYGFNLASNLLSSCSLEKILVNVKSHKIKFSSSQILKIIKKYPESTEQILEIMEGYSKNFKDEYVALFKYFSRNNLLLFFKLREKYKSQFIVGWRITEKFVRTHKEDIIQNHERYFAVFNNKRIVKTLGNDYSRVFIKLFPTSVNYYHNQKQRIFSVFKSLPKNMKDIHFLLNTFEQAYGFSLLNHPEYITADIMNMLSISERAGVLKIGNRPKGISEFDWYCYYNTSISIPYLKKRISLTSDVKKRCKLITYLVKTCSLNDDMEALAQLCEYMVKRHRNDDLSVRVTFFRTMEVQIDLKKLEKRHWDSIEELKQIFSMNGEKFNYSKNFLTAHIYFCLDNQLPIKEEFTELIKKHTYEGFHIFKDRPEYEKECLFLTYEIGSELYNIFNATLNYYTISSFYNNFIDAVYDWNFRHPEDTIDMFTFPLLFECVKRGIKENNCCRYMDRMLLCLLCYRSDHEETQSLLKRYLSMSIGSISGDILNFLIQYRPLIVSQDIENITKLAITKRNWGTRHTFWKFSSNYIHLDIPQRMIPLCIEKHRTNEGALEALSHLMSTYEFLNFIAPYYPTTPQADSKTEEGRSLYETQRSITKYLVNVQPASAILPTILKFCQGDYLKLILRSLYSASDTTNENKLLEFFSAFTDSAVSVRKHAMHLTFRLLEQANIFGVLSKFMETETNASIRKYLFKGIFNHFVKNPDDKSWEMMKLNLSEVDVDDKEALAVLMEVDKIPASYFLHYIVFAWQFLDKYGDSYVGEKSSLLRRVTPLVIRELPQEFCESIITKYFFNYNDSSLTSHQSLIQTFTCQFIIYYEPAVEQQHQRLIKYFDIATKFVNISCGDRNMHNDRRNCVVNFLKEFCLQFIAKGCSDKPILYKFVELWNNFVQPHEAFHVHLHLQFTLIYMEKLSLVEMGQQISQLYHASVNSYGIVIVQVFYKYLKFFLKYFYDGNETEAKRMALIEGIMDWNQSSSSLLLVIAMLADGREPSDKALIVKYNSILDVIKNNPDQTVQVFNTIYLGGSTTLDYY